MRIDKSCKITEKELIAHGAGDIYSVWLDCPELADEVRPGQFADIRCGSFTLRRPISICEKSANGIRLVFEVRGEGTEWLAGRETGGTLDLLAPIGNGFELISGANALLIGGGIGVPPLLELAKYYGNSASAALGFRHGGAVILERDFASRCETVIATEDGSCGVRGYVSAAAEKLAEARRPDIIYACGPAPLLKYAAGLAERLGIRCQLSLEQRMGCGVGACLVCVCKVRTGGGYKRVCKDGPVFEASDVELD